MQDVNATRLLTRVKLLLIGVNELKNNGYMAANARNITENETYREMFRETLEGHRGIGGPTYDVVIDELLAEIDKKEERHGRGGS